MEEVSEMNGVDRLLVLAIRHATYVMQNVDPDDRTPSEVALVAEVKDWMVHANKGDEAAARMLSAAHTKAEWEAMQ